MKVYHKFKDGILIPTPELKLCDKLGDELPTAKFRVPVRTMGPQMEETLISFLRAESADDAYIRTKTRSIEGYETDPGPLPRMIAQPQYDSLPDSFKGKYRKVENETIQLVPLSESPDYEVGVESSEAMGTYFDAMVNSREKGIGVRYEGAVRTFFVRDVAESLVAGIAPYKTVMATKPHGSRSSLVVVDYLDSAYDGKTRRVYDKYKNGRQKRTYREVPNYVGLDHLDIFSDVSIEGESPEIVKGKIDKIIERLTFGKE